MNNKNLKLINAFLLSLLVVVVFTFKVELDKKDEKLTNIVRQYEEELYLKNHRIENMQAHIDLISKQSQNE